MNQNYATWFRDLMAEAGIGYGCLIVSALVAIAGALLVGFGAVAVVRVVWGCLCQ